MWNENNITGSNVSVDKKNTMLLLLSKSEHSPLQSLLPLLPSSLPRLLSVYKLTQGHHSSGYVTPFGTPLTLSNISDRWGGGLCPWKKTVATLLRHTECPNWIRGDLFFWGNLCAFHDVLVLVGDTYMTVFTGIGITPSLQDGRTYTIGGYWAPLWLDLIIQWGRGLKHGG